MIADKDMPVNRRLPWYGWAGLLTLLVGEAGLFLGLVPVQIMFYCIAWWSYIFLVDAFVWRRRGFSLVRSRPWEFWFLAFWSVPIWNLFEVFNFRLQNWFYINVPLDETVGLILNVTSYATVLLGIFETYDALRAYGVFERARVGAWRVTSPLVFGFAAGGLGMLVAFLVWPRLAFPLIWGFAVLLGDPVCYWAGSARTDSLLGQLERGDPRPALRLLLAGLICGGLWEFWNFWAYTKWLYTVPYLEHLKWFEMPPLGFLGFPPFALECYVLVNLLNTVRRGRSWESCERTGPGTPRWLAVLAVAAALAFNAVVFAGIQAMTVQSVAPTLADMEGISAGTLERLARAGVTTPPVYLRRTATVERLTALARETGLPPDELTELREAARLVDLDGLGADHYNALRRLGITRIEELARQDPSVLLTRWQAETAGRSPTLPQVTLWVRAARRASAPTGR
jgi:transcriptional regulator with XRE-family HTH domain